MDGSWKFCQTPGVTSQWEFVDSDLSLSLTLLIDLRFLLLPLTVLSVNHETRCLFVITKIVRKCTHNFKDSYPMSVQIHTVITREVLTTLYVFLSTSTVLLIVSLLW